MKFLRFKDYLRGVMFTKIKINEKGIVYIPDEIRKEGYVGDVDMMVGIGVSLLIKPGTSYEALIRGIDLLKKEVKLRLDYDKACNVISKS
jgi:hypothetical protein